MWQTKGRAKNINKSIIAPYSRKKSVMNWLHPHVIRPVAAPNEKFKFAGISSLSDVNVTFPIVYDIKPEILDEIHEGDILKITSDGLIQRLFDCTSDQNVLFMTEYCNSRCIMCPQPQMPCDHSDEVMNLLQYIPKDRLHRICLTGGEPTLSKKLFEILRKLKEYAHVEPLILTNGRKFSDPTFARQVVANAPFNTVYAIPLYSTIPAVHDEIVGCEGAFQETILGIYNLTRFRVPIELRVVLTKKNAFNLAALAEFIGWNLPMVVHVAFMGLEVYGRANANVSDVWIEPADYMKDLMKAVKMLDYRNIDVSIYNLPLCLLPVELRKYSRLSISTWKQGYTPQCQNCVAKNRCTGIFTTSSIVPKGISPIMESSI